jgi:lysophospholipase L1-like esterase
MRRKDLLGSITYFDALVGLTVLTLVSIFFAPVVPHRPAWIWNIKDSLGLGLLLGAMLAFILLRRRVSAQSTFWLRAVIAASLVAAGAVLFRRWDGIWVGVGVMLLLFSLLLRSKPVSEESAWEYVSEGLLVVTALLFSVILAEGILRYFPALLSRETRARFNWQRVVEHPWHVAHPYIGHLHNVDDLRKLKTDPSASTAGFWHAPVRFDAWGFRNTTPWPERVDIITVGDSVTYGLTVNDEQAWPALLERALAPQHVLNLGLVGAAPQQYLRVYETFGAQLSPKVLLVGLFLGNDLTDALNFHAWWRAKSHKSFIDFLLKRDRMGANGWLQKSYLYMSLKDLYAAYKGGRILGKTVQLTDGGQLYLNPTQLEKQAAVGSPGQPAFALVLHTLEHLCTLATQQQTHCLVLIVPDREQVYLPILGDAAVNLAAPLLPELENRGIASLDLGPHFRQRAAAGETLFWEEDGHPNVRGYALIAEVVLAHLKEHTASYGLD